MNEIVNNKVNLCDSCSQVYPDCTSKPENVYFGDGIGHDNICACSEYRPSTQPQLEDCPIYGGMCGYPSNLCYECPRHEGAKEQPQWWTEGLQPFAQPQSTMGQVTDAVQSTKDCISRQAAIDALEEIDCSDGDGLSALKCDAVDDAIVTIKALPSAQQKRKKGRWIYGEHDIAMCDGYRCDKCGFFVPWDYKFKFIDFINDYHFCPNCGSDMRGNTDEI